MARLADRLRAAYRAAKRAWASPSRRDAYKGAEVNRLVEDWFATITQPDDEARWNLRRLRARSRELSRNNPFARAFLTSLSANVLGPAGPTLQAQVRDNSGDLNRRINDRIEAAWAEWAEVPTVDGGLTLARFQHQTLKAVARDGEAFVRKRVGFDGNPWAFALEPIDADQLDETYSAPGVDGGNEVRMGVEIDPTYGRRVAYHFFKKPPALGLYAMQRVRVPASEVIHLYDPERCNQTRGIPWSSTVMWPLKMLEGYMESEAVAARASAAKMGFWTRKPNEATVGEITGDPETNTITMDASPGTFDFAPDGYELAPWDPQHPNTVYEAFVKMKLREVASGLGMSYNNLANDLENVNYSSIRSGLLVERDVWRTIQHWWIGSFLRPVYCAWLDASLLSGSLVLDSRDFRKFLAAQWTPRGWPWVDPEKDGKAGVIQIQMGLTSRRRLLAEQGLDPETILEELAEEKALAEQYGVDVSGPPPAAGFGGGARDEDVGAELARNGHRSRTGALGRR